MTTAHFDCFNGAAGDMIVAALIDAGADEGRLREGVDSLGLTGFELSIEKVKKQGFAATRFHVAMIANETQPHRHLADIAKIISNSDLPDKTKNRSIQVFEKLAHAEAKVHGSTADKIHFHEVGAVDSILDITCAMHALELLQIDPLYCSPIPVGSGTVRCEHGVLPVPAPATAELLRGIPIAESSEAGELTTPTAAAILTTLAEDFGPMPAMTISSIGYGAGTRDGIDTPNVLRVILGQTAGSPTSNRVAVLETNIDDSSPEVIGHCMEQLHKAGALDAFVTPVQMKKSRPGVMLTVLCEPARVDSMEKMLFAETSTFGIRRHDVTRVILARRYETVATRFGDIRMKIGELNGTLKASPEYEDCRKAAAEFSVPVHNVILAAQGVWESGSKSTG